MCYGAGTNLTGIACNGHSLEDALAGHADGVTVVAQHIAKDHVLQRLLVVLLSNIKSNILLCAQLVGILLVGLQLLGAETTCVGTCGIHLITLLLCQIHHGVAGIKATTEGNHNFLLFHLVYCLDPPPSPPCMDGSI